MAIQGRALRRGSHHRTDVTAGLSRLYDAGFHDTSRPRGRRGSSSRRNPWFAVAGAAVFVSLATGIVVTRVDWTDLEVTGIDDGQRLQRKDLGALRLRIVADGPAASGIEVELNGTEIPVTDAKKGSAVIATGPDLTEALRPGQNRLVVTLGGRYLLGGERIERTFDFDPSGPKLMVPRQVVDPDNGEAITIRGIADDTVELTANGAPVVIEEGGGFQVDLSPGATTVKLVAKDSEGNPGTTRIEVTDTPVVPAYPGTAGGTVAVHVSASDWSNPMIRQQVIDLAESGRINAVQLDIKDEAGEVGYESEVPLAKKIGATRPHYDAAEALAELHDLDMRVIGRVVCFLDPAMAEWAVANDRTDLLVMDGAGTSPLANDYGSAAFTNLASPEVRDYQVDLAEEAVRLGFDEILYDYVRRPEGDLATMSFDGLKSSPSVAIARFVAETNDRLDGTDAALGVSVFGIAASRPEQIAQDMALLAPHVDYVAPMVYPSHWGPGEYGVADPVRQPGDIVAASVADFEQVIAGSGAAVVPWLQDFDSGSVTYTAPMVRAQIDSARFAGAEGVLLWNPNSLYTRGVLDPM